MTSNASFNDNAARAIGGYNSFPKPIRHFHSLKDGRLLAYYTFATGHEENERDLHPVLYFHGFPGSGIEGAIYANEEIKYKCKVYGIDRPGFGSSSQPRPSDVSPQEYMEHFLDDIFDFAKAQKWTKYSVIGLSGGGPYALAHLDRYIKQTANRQQVLTSVSVVAGVCCAAGSNGMMDTNKTLVKYINSGSWWKLFLLKIIMIVQSFLIRLLPVSWLSDGLLNQLPKVDKDCVYSNDSAVLNVFMDAVKEAFKQGSSAAYKEMQFLFSIRDQPFHRSLRERFLFLGGGGSDDTDNPKVAIFHGTEDVNVPLSHSRYVYESMLNGPEHPDSITFKEYPGMGHISLAVLKASDVMQHVAMVSR